MKVKRKTKLSFPRCDKYNTSDLSHVHLRHMLSYLPFWQGQSSISHFQSLSGYLGYLKFQSRSFWKRKITFFTLINKSYLNIWFLFLITNSWVSRCEIVLFFQVLTCISCAVFGTFSVVYYLPYNILFIIEHNIPT